MSYILDALKKAESERERGAVPGLHAQPIQPIRQADTPAKPLALMALIAGAFVLIAVLAWRWLSPAPAEPIALIATAPLAAPITSVAPTAPPAAIVPSQVSQMPSAPAAQPAPPPVALAAPAPVPPVATPLPSGTEARPEVRMAPATISPMEPPARKEPAADARQKSAVKPPVKPADKPPVKAAEPVTSPAAPVSRVPVPSVPAPASPRIATLSELPQDVRLALPKLVISGSTYSDNPTYRMVIINGQVFREGDKVAPDMTLEKIRQGSAVLDYKGQRYSVGY